MLRPIYCSVTTRTPDKIHSLWPPGLDEGFEDRGADFVCFTAEGSQQYRPCLRRPASD